MIRERVDRYARIGDVEQLVVQLQRVEAGARLRRHGAEIDDHRLIGQDEAFGDEDQRLRRIDPAEAGKQIAECLDGLVGLEGDILRERVRLDLDLPAAHFLRARRHRDPLALPGLHPFERRAVSLVDRLRFDQRDVVTEVDRSAGLLLADHAADGLLDAFAVRREGRRGSADAKAGHRHAVRRRQAIDERVRRLGNRQCAAEPDVRLVDGHDDQAAAGGTLVGAVPVRRQRHRGAGWLRRERDPFGRHDAPRVAVDADDKVGGRQVGDRLAAIVDDRDVERGDFDRRLKARLRRRLLRVHGPAEAERHVHRS